MPKPIGLRRGSCHSLCKRRIGAGEGDRTLVLSLENSCSTIELHPQLYSKHTDYSIRTASGKAMVGEVGLEPTKP
jgi:hypothetical protein